MVCSKWAERRPSAGDDGPAVVEGLGLGAAGVDHGLDGEDVADLEPHPLAGRPVVRDLRVLVHGGADPVTDVLADHGEPGRLRLALDRGADVAELLAFDDLVDRGLERAAR